MCNLVSIEQYHDALVFRIATYGSVQSTCARDAHHYEARFLRSLVGEADATIYRGGYPQTEHRRVFPYTQEILEGERRGDDDWRYR